MNSFHAHFIFSYIYSDEVRLLTKKYCTQAENINSRFLMSFCEKINLSCTDLGSNSINFQSS